MEYNYLKKDDGSKIQIRKNDSQPTELTVQEALLRQLEKLTIQEALLIQLENKTELHRKLIKLLGR